MDMDGVELNRMSRDMSWFLFVFWYPAEVLTALQGVGPVTASALLCRAFPQLIAYMSDEAAGRCYDSDICGDSPGHAMENGWTVMNFVSVFILYSMIFDLFLYHKCVVYTMINM